jgi:curved DNA-binding protein CbpA
MARINAAYDVLRDPVRRARYDASPHAWRAREAERASGREAGDYPGAEPGGPVGPPPPPPTRPVTARFDTSAAFHRRNATTAASRTPLRGQAPRDRRGIREATDLRASDPTGPVRRARSSRSIPTPSLEEARATVLEFGRFHGATLGEVADREPTYVDWIARTITRDRDLVIRARVVAADLDERGIERVVRPPRPGFGSEAMREAAEYSAG